MLAKEKLLSSSKAKQTILDLTSPAKRTSTGELKVIESKTLDSAIANVFYENALPFTVADSPSLARLVEQCIEFGQQNPGRKYKAPNRRRIAGPLLPHLVRGTGPHMGTFTQKFATALHPLRLRNWYTFIPIGRQWRHQLVTMN